MNKYQRAKRKAATVGAIMAAALYSSVLLLPALAGYVTVEQPVIQSGE